MKKILLILLFSYSNLSFARHANVFSSVDTLVIVFDDDETELLKHSSYSHLNNEEIRQVYQAFGITDNERVDLIDEFFADSSELYFMTIHRSNSFFDWFAKYRNAEEDYLVLGSSA